MDGIGTTSSEAAASSGAPKQVATSGANGLLVTGSYVALPVVAGVFAFFL
jgi:hypothetical protein